MLLKTTTQKLSDIKRGTKYDNFIKYPELLIKNDSRIINLMEKGNQKIILQKLDPMLPAALTAFVTFIMKNKQNLNTAEIANEIKALMAEEK